MTGPFHYQAAEKYLALFDVERDPEAWMSAVRSGELAVAMQAASVHATLALAAATALYDADLEDGQDTEAQAWKRIAGSGVTP